MRPLAVVIALSVAQRLEFNSTKEQQFDPELLVDKILVPHQLTWDGSLATNNWKCSLTAAALLRFCPTDYSGVAITKLWCRL